MMTGSRKPCMQRSRSRASTETTTLVDSDPLQAAAASLDRVVVLYMTTPPHRRSRSRTTTGQLASGSSLRLVSTLEHVHMSTTLPAAGRGLLVHRPSSLVGPPSCPVVSTTPRLGRRRPARRLPLRCSSTPPVVDEAATTTTPGKNDDGGEYYRPSFADDLLLGYFRSKMVEEVGWDSEKPGYAGLIEVATRPMIKGKTASEIEQSAVRVLRSLFPTLLLDLFKALFVPVANGRLACMMVARATVLSSQWLMGRCSVNSVTLPDGKSLSSGVFVEKCKYLDESKCIGMCINTCKLPTQTFFKDHMGVDLYMEPNFEDYSCQFSFGVQPPPVDADKALKEPCLDTCSNARRHRDDREIGKRNELSCPQV